MSKPVWDPRLLTRETACQLVEDKTFRLDNEALCGECNKQVSLPGLMTLDTLITGLMQHNVKWHDMPTKVVNDE